MEELQPNTDFDAYLRQGEPAARESAANWSIATGLQAVDGLKPSDYLYEVASRNIEGKITIDESCELIRSYYVSRTSRESEDSIGFDVNNEMFAKHSWYFRNALVRANYRTT